MAENEERLPLVALKDVEFGKSIRIKLDCAKAVKTGESRYGNWYLWFGYVNNAIVREGRKPNEKVIKDYTGKALFFPTEKLNEEMEKATDGNVDVDIEIFKNVETGARGQPLTRYVLSKLTMGKKFEGTNTLTPTEAKLVADSKELKDDGYKITEELFLKAALEPQYGSKISPEKAKELYKLV